MTAVLAPATAAGAATDRPSLPAIGPLSTVHQEDVNAAAAGIDTWLRDMSDGYVTLERVTMVAGSLPVIGNILALLDTANDIISVVEKVNHDIETKVLDWASLGINLVGVIPLPLNMAAARMSFRPMMTLVKQELNKGVASVGEAVVQFMVSGLADTIVGELETFVSGFQRELGPLLDLCVSKSDEVIDDLVAMLAHCIGDPSPPGQTKRIPQALKPEKVLHDPLHQSTWAHMLAAVSQAAANTAGYAERQVTKVISEDIRRAVRRVMAALLKVKALFRSQLTNLGSTALRGSIAMLLQWTLRPSKAARSR